MKKTIKISLQGSIFHVDEDAYMLLKQYLADISDYFRSREEGAEIIQDIETRIAEIFTERLDGAREVITLEDIDFMISQMGKPADIFGEEDDSGYIPPPYTYGRKRLYRDPENSVLGGVCGGLGAYFDIDPVWFRVFFVLLMLGYGVAVLIYILLWIILPEARTAAQRLEMRGEQVNVDNIGKTVNREFQKVRENLKNVSNSAAYHKTRNAFQEFFHVIGQILLMILKFVAIIIGISLIIAGVVTLVTLTGMLFFRYSWFFPGEFLYPSFYLPDLLALITNPENVPYIIASLILTIGIPLLALVYGGIKIIFRIHTGNRAIGLTFFVLWLVSAISLSFFIMDIASNYSKRAMLNESVTVGTPETDTLFIAASTFPADNIDEIFSFDRAGLYRNEETGVLLGRPEIDIVHSGGDAPELEIYRRARGKTREIAIRHAEKIQYQWNQKGKHLYIDPWFRSGQRFYTQEIEFRLRIPEGTVICLGKDLKYLLHFIPNENGYPGYNMAGRCWVMTEEKLKLSD
ncbi:MAG: PspC domain-containing protein [Chlorobi bacterium]|nr:PspC domain-containing protein [Chlorobiota bacterium]